MLKNGFILLISFLVGLPLFAQTTYRVTGKVTNNKLEPLAFVSIQVGQSQAGTISKEDGSYALTLREGT
ncbi:MAG TPA: hypothetical protein VFS22_05185 [Flavisolibacter sp.]|nr:hypothetical protein [Flavisolibacter sp.]